MISIDAFWWVMFAIVLAAGLFLIVQSLRYTASWPLRLAAVVMALVMIAPAWWATHRLTYHPTTGRNTLRPR